MTAGRSQKNSPDIERARDEVSPRAFNRLFSSLDIALGGGDARDRSPAWCFVQIPEIQRLFQKA